MQLVRTFMAAWLISHVLAAWHRSLIARPLQRRPSIMAYRLPEPAGLAWTTPTLVEVEYTRSGHFVHLKILRFQGHFVHPVPGSLCAPGKCFFGWQFGDHKQPFSGLWPCVPSL